jgi:hypothetical protein
MCNSCGCGGSKESVNTMNQVEEVLDTKILSDLEIQKEEQGNEFAYVQSSSGCCSDTGEDCSC